MGSVIFIIFLCICSSSAVDKVLFVDQINYGIYHSDIEPGKLLTQQVYQRARFEHIYRPGVMTYDFMTNMVIWGQRSPHKIGGDILDGVPNTVNIVPGIKPFLIAFNKHDRRIYWFGNVSLILASARLDGTNKIRVHVNDKRIFGLCIDGQNSLLYFSEGDSIMQMNVDGTGKKSLVDEDLVNVTAFTRNAQDGNLFWINHDRTIEMYDIVKHVRNIVTTISIELGYVEQILIYDDIFYWVDIGRGGIGYLNLLDHVRSGFSDSIPVNGEHQSLAGILRMKVFINESVDLCHPSPCEPGLQCVSTIYNYECVATNLTGNGTGSGATVEPHTHTNLCEANGEHYPCDYIRGVCLYVNGSAVCGCEGGYLLADDNVTCLGITFLIIITTADKVFFVDQINFGIYHSDIEPGMVLTDQLHQRAFFEFIHRPGVMTYDFVTNMVVWGQRSPHKIGGDVLDGVPNKVVIIPGVKPFCITFSNFDRRIYWFGNVSRILASIRLDGTKKIRIDYNDRHIYGLSADGQKG
nr:prolow-density lipoprotein receptor-related protein 1-like [Lytechinus pictus]